MKNLNEAAVVSKWAPMIKESLNVTSQDKLEWMSKYAHFHSLNESAMGGVSFPYATLHNTQGIGNAQPAGFAAMTGAQQTNPAAHGSGDKWPSLLPMSLQVAGRTVGFDLLNVVPMSGPTGVITYLDYVYAGGKAPYGATPGHSPSSKNPSSLSNADAALVFKIQAKFTAVLAAGTELSFANATEESVTCYFIGKSRIDGYPMFRIGAFSSPELNLSEVFDGSDITITGATLAEGTKIGYPSSVSTLEDHIQGFVGAGVDDKDPWTGNWVDGTELYEPMDRGTGETMYPRPLNLQMFTKFVQVGTVKVAIQVTQEQIQDLNKQWGIDVIDMIENAAINDISQSINKHITSHLFGLGWKNHIRAFEAEGINLNLDLTQRAGSAKLGKTAAFAYANEGQKVNEAMNFQGVSFGPSDVTSPLVNQDVVIKALMAHFVVAGNVIMQRGRRGPANFAVMGAKLAGALQSNTQYSFSPIQNTISQGNGQLYPLGVIAGITIYVDPMMEYNDTRILVGRKGTTEEPGAIFCPYLMAESVKLMAEGTASPKVVMSSRYAIVDAGFHPETQYLTFAVKTSAGAII